MSRILKTFLALSLLLPLLLAACGGGPDVEAEGDASDGAQRSNARLAELPSQEGSPTDALPEGHPPLEPQELPPGHPPMGQAAAPMGLPPVPEGAGTGSSGLSWATPEGWVEVPPASPMRRAQYRVPGESGDGELVVFYFGPGQGGTPEANAERWIGQFQGPDGRPAPGTTHTTTVHDMKVLMVEVSGTYSGGMTMMGAPSQSLENHMLLGAIAEGPDANWFFKLTGPKVTLEAQKAAFESLVGSLQAGG